MFNDGDFNELCEIIKNIKLPVIDLTDEYDICENMSDYELELMMEDFIAEFSPYVKDY